MSTVHPVIIIGSGPAGYTAAIYAARAGQNPVLISGLQPGGQLTITTDVENYPGFANPIQGPDLMEQMRLQAVNVGTIFIHDIITRVDFTKRPFTLVSDQDVTYQAHSVIITTGAEARWLGLNSEKRFKGFGVSACATCDGFFFRDQDVAVVGGGNTAVEEALYLTHHARSVTLIHRRNQLRAENILQKRLFEHDKIIFVHSHQVEEILGSHDPLAVKAVRIANTIDGSEQTLKVAAVFIAIGHDPATGLFKNYLNMDKHGYIITAADSTKTNIAGVFAAGDVADPVYRQAVTAAGMGCMAALEAEKYLATI